MTEFVEVAVLVPGRLNTFDYHLPLALQGQVKAGCLVVVPFGRQRVQGVVVRTVAHPQVQETRAVESLLDPQPVIQHSQMALAFWMHQETLAPLAACLDLMLPPGVAQQADILVKINPAVPSDDQLISPLQRRILALIEQRGELRGRQIEAAFRRQNWKAALQSLARSGVVTSQPYLADPAARPKMIRLVRLAIPAEKAAEIEPLLGKTGSAAAVRRKAALAFLAREGRAVDAHWVYAASGASAMDLKRLAENGWIEFVPVQVIRDPLVGLHVEPQPALALTNAQASALEQVVSALRSSEPQKPFILHGITGSGKTEIYLQAVAETLRQGRQAIVLVPEIALTPQTIQRFHSRFPGRVGVIHSGLSTGERYDTWQRTRAGQIGVIIGARSALFSPLPQLGLIVVDECHEPSYYQQEPAPSYNAAQTAIEYARLSNAVVLLGSATPEISMMYRARQAGWKILHLPLRIMAHRAAVQSFLETHRTNNEIEAANGEAAFMPLPPVEVVDMRQEFKAGNRSMFSAALKNAIRQVLDHRQQAILYLNRLGSATYVFCRECGAALCCPRCDRPLTYHQSNERLVCHACNYRRLLPRACPQCGSANIRQFGAGSERVEQEILAHFSDARVLRWDSQTTRTKGAHKNILDTFLNGKADILVGTQMLAKGLDLPLVTLVGVVLADVGLNLEDFRAAERTFQLLTQVAGRAGRSPLGGRVILQSFQPDHYAIQAAARHDYAGFYAYELDQRRKIAYPPFTRLARLEIRHASGREAERQAREMAARLEDWIKHSACPNCEIIGPVPCFFAREGGKFRWQVILKGNDPASVLREKELQDWRVQIDPQSLL
ncbi:MAG: primosomal protein N' [Chloroflexota bacterium]